MLTVEDVFNQDGGEIVNWGVEVCSAVDPPEDINLVNQIFVVPFGQDETITNTYLEASGFGDDLSAHTYIII